jgi:prepilin-type N-terminal cleavage/methylation domain-containing protein
MKKQRDMKGRRPRGGEVALRRAKGGFTVVEVAIVVAIIGLLAIMAIPAVRKARMVSQATRVANDLRVFGDAFQQYCIETGLYPADCDLPDPWHLPNTKMEGYMKKETWKTQTPLGGNYEWEGPSWGEGGPFAYAGISLSGSTAVDEALREVDRIVDDSNLLTGNFRKMPNNRATYVIEER